MSESTPSTLALLKQKSQEIIKNKTQDQFYNNPLFQPLKSDGSANPNWEKNRQVFLEHTNQIPKEEQRSLYDTPIIPGIKGTSAKDVVDLGGEMITNAAKGVNAGLETFNKGVGTLVGAAGSQAGGVGKKAEEITKGTLEAGTGLTQAGFAGGTLAVPELAAFVASSDEIKKVAEKNLDEHEAKFLKTAVDAPFAAVSTMAEKLGFDPVAHPNVAMGMELANLFVMVAGHSAYTKAKEGGLPLPTPIKSLKDLQDLSKTVAENKATPEQKAELNSFVEAVGDVTPAKIHEVAKDSDNPAAKEIAIKIEDTQKLPEHQISPEVESINNKLEDLSKENQTETVVNAIEKLNAERDNLLHQDHSAVIDNCNRSLCKGNFS